MDELAGVILAGGQSRRMGNKDKCLMQLSGTPLIQHVSNKLSRSIDRILINTNGNPDDFAFLEHDIKSDVFEGYAGPLAGVLTGMRWAQNNPGIDWIITAAADTPFFPSHYVEQMFASKGDNEIVLAASDGRKHPVFGLWKISLADTLEAFLTSGDRKVMLFVEKYRHHIEPFGFDERDPFFNLNTPEDWQLANQIVADIEHD